MIDSGCRVYREKITGELAQVKAGLVEFLRIKRISLANWMISNLHLTRDAQGLYLTVESSAPYLMVGKKGNMVKELASHIGSKLGQKVHIEVVKSELWEGLI